MKPAALILSCYQPTITFIHMLIKYVSLLSSTRSSSQLISNGAAGHESSTPSEPVCQPLCCSNPPHSIIPKFGDWKNPHSDILSWWLDMAPTKGSIIAHTASGFSTAVQSLERTYRVTNSSDGCSAAHLIPEKEWEWCDD